MATIQNDPLAADEPNPALGVLRRNAEWASMFGSSKDPRQPVNLALRARRQEDLDKYAAAAVAEQERRTRQAIETDRTRQALWFRQQQLAQRKQEANFRMGLAQEKHDAEMALAPFKQSALEAQIKSSTALEAERIAREKAINDRAARDSSDRTAVYDGLNRLDQEVSPDSPEYAKNVLGLMSKYGKTLDPDTRKAIFDRAGLTSGTDPVEEAQKTMDAWDAVQPYAQSHGLDLHMQKTPQGKWGFNLRPATAPHSQSGVQLKALKSGLARAQVKESMATDLEKPDVQQGIQSLTNKIAAIENPTGSTSGVGMGDVQAAEATPSQSDIIERNGVKYRVDHANKKVLGIVE